jgi:protein-S-isoprenylcysteine O-methyltransferase Ste14
MKTSLFIKQLFGTLLFFAIIFISAGRIVYWQGLVFVLTGIFMLILNYSVLRPDDELMRERSRPGEGSKKWDKGILGLSFLATISMYVVAGLDSGRFHWSPDFSPFLYALGILLNTAGQLLFLIAQKQNRFFSSTVRIQTDRGHAVCDTGLYKFVRHPAYLGIIIQSAGFPLFFGSLWSIIPAGSLIILNIIRASLEDKTLKNELSGYLEFTNKTRYRLFPLLW